MTPHTFVLTLVVASAVLAFWCGARFPTFGPTTFTFGVLHLFAGLAAVRAISPLTNAVKPFAGELAPLIASFGIALPLFTYAFLTGLWVTRLIHRSLSSGLPS
jgi:hypothetical protein